MGEHTPGPWDYVPSTEHHGPYVTCNYGATICDCYVMSLPREQSTASGGPSKPIHHLHEMADPNARLIAATPQLFEALKLALQWVDPDSDPVPLSAREVCATLRAAIAKAEGRA